MVVYGDRYARCLKKKRRLDEFLSVVEGVYPDAVEVRAGKTSYLERHERDMFNKGEIPCKKLRKPDEPLVVLVNDDDPYLDASAMCLQVENATNCLIECAVRLHDVVMQRCVVGVYWNANHDVMVPNSGICGCK